MIYVVYTQGDAEAVKVAVGLPGVPATAPMKEAVRVATIDNFQGEESTVIILSLVRNNRCGRNSVPKAVKFFEILPLLYTKCEIRTTCNK